MKRPNTRNSAKNTKSKKRKAEEDLTMAPPLKVLKSDHQDQKSGRRAANVLSEEPVRVSNPNGIQRGRLRLTDLS